MTISRDKPIPPILRSLLFVGVPRRTSLFDPSSKRFTDGSTPRSFAGELQAHRAYANLSTGVQKMLLPLANHIDLMNNRLVTALEGENWEELYRAGLCEGGMDNEFFEILLNGEACSDRLVAWLGSCVIDSILDANLDDNDTAEAKEQLGTQYIYPGVTISVAKDPRLPTREELDELFDVSVTQLNEGFRFDENKAISEGTAPEGGKPEGTALGLIPPAPETGQVLTYEDLEKFLAEKERGLGAVSSAVDVIRASLCVAHLCTYLSGMCHRCDVGGRRSFRNKIIGYPGCMFTILYDPLIMFQPNFSNWFPPGSGGIWKLTWKNWLKVALSRVVDSSTRSLLVRRRLWRLIAGHLWSLAAPLRPWSTQRPILRYTDGNFVHDVQKIAIEATGEVTSLCEAVFLSSLDGGQLEPFFELTEEAIQDLELDSKNKSMLLGAWRRVHNVSDTASINPESLLEGPQEEADDSPTISSERILSEPARFDSHLLSRIMTAMVLSPSVAPDTALEEWDGIRTASKQIPSLSYGDHWVHDQLAHSAPRVDLTERDTITIDFTMEKPDANPYQIPYPMEVPKTVHTDVHKNMICMNQMNRAKIVPFESLNLGASTKLLNRVGMIVSISADFEGNPILQSRTPSGIDSESVDEGVTFAARTPAPQGWLGDALRNYSVIHMVADRNLGRYDVDPYKHTYHQMRKLTGLDMDMARVVSGKSSYPQYAAMLDAANTRAHFTVMSLAELFEDKSDNAGNDTDSGDENDMVHECTFGLNFLELPEGKSITVPMDVADASSIAIGSQYRRFLKARHFPTAFDLAWRTIACEGSYSDPHVDGGGMCTWIRVQKGGKAFCFRWRDTLAESVPDLPPHRDDLTRWTLLFPQEGDILYMAPGTVHMVAGLTDCMTEGGHFCTRSTSVHSLYELLEVEIFGYDNSNGDYYDTSVGYRIELLHALMSEVTLDPTLVKKPVYVMDFAAILAYVQNWSGKTTTAEDDEPTSVPTDRESVRPLPPVFPGEDTEAGQRALTVSLLQKDREAALKCFEVFQKRILLSDTCISSSAEALTRRITALLGTPLAVPKDVTDPDKGATEEEGDVNDDNDNDDEFKPPKAKKTPSAQKKTASTPKKKTGPESKKPKKNVEPKPAGRYPKRPRTDDPPSGPTKKPRGT